MVRSVDEIIEYMSLIRAFFVWWLVYSQIKTQTYCCVLAAAMGRWNQPMCWVCVVQSARVTGKWPGRAAPCARELRGLGETEMTVRGGVSLLSVYAPQA